MIDDKIMEMALEMLNVSDVTEGYMKLYKDMHRPDSVINTDEYKAAEQAMNKALRCKIDDVESKRRYVNQASKHFKRAKTLVKPDSPVRSNEIGACDDGIMWCNGELDRINQYEKQVLNVNR